MWTLKSSLPVMLALIVGATHPGSGLAQDRSPTPLKASLQGTWQMISRINNGAPSDSGTVRNRTVTFAGDKYTVRDGAEVVAAPRYEVDPTRSPVWLNVLHEGNDPHLGIIKLEGDTLTRCVKTGVPRPDSFRSEPGDGRLLMRFKRVRA
jgi:uncharacterized protein (TIGR03067 family)